MCREQPDEFVDDPRVGADQNVGLPFSKSTSCRDRRGAPMDLKVGMRLRSTACSTEVVIVAHRPLRSISAVVERQWWNLQRNRHTLRSLPLVPALRSASDTPTRQVASNCCARKPALAHLRRDTPPSPPRRRSRSVVRLVSSLTTRLTRDDPLLDQIHLIEELGGSARNSARRRRPGRAARPRLRRGTGAVPGHDVTASFLASRTAGRRTALSCPGAWLGRQP